MSRVARACGARSWMVPAAAALALLAFTPPAPAAAPAWRIDAVPETVVTGGTLTYLIEVRNVGDAVADGAAEPIVLSGELPDGLTVVSGPPTMDCSGLVPGAHAFSCSASFSVLPYLTSPAFHAVMPVEVAVDPAASGALTSRFTIAGGDPSDGDPALPTASTVAAIAVPTEAAFGIAAFDAQVAADALGTPLTQAGGHPYAATTTLDFRAFRHPDPLKGNLTPVEAVKDVEVDLPPGFFGDPSGVGQCTLAQLSNTFKPADARALCPPAAQVGVTYVHVYGPHILFGPVPVFNMVPPVDAPARLGFNFAGVVTTVDVTVRTGGDYGLTARLRDVSEGLGVAGATLTLWGDPADPVHDVERACPGDSAPFAGGRTCTTGTQRTAFLRNPTSCGDPAAGLPTTLRVDSWVHPGDFRSRTALSHLPPGYPYAPPDWGAQAGTTGCDKVPFDPRLTAAPDTTAAAEPAGFSFDLTLPQSNDPGRIGESDLRAAVVTMPLGVHLSTSAAAGLAGCSPAQIGLHSTADPTCPDGSKIGTVSIRTPALPDPLEGSIYLAAPHDNPFGSLVALYVVASGSGVTVKLPGEVALDPLTGQVTTTFDDNPQLPFARLHLELKGGPRAPLANPLACGTYTTHAALTGWNGSAVSSDSSFTITQDGHGAPCPGATFSPSFAAGTESASAGRSSPLHVRLGRRDGDQELGSLSLRMPEGLLGYISKVTLCGDAAARAGTCPASSRIGRVTVGAGSGPNPFYVTGGRVYLTGPYKGAPYGLSVVVPAKAGPFDLGDVVVRQSIFVDRHTARLRIVSDPLPTLLQGVTLGVRDVRVAIGKAGFTLNPTSCATKRIRGQITSTAGRTAAVSTRFQAVECRNLRFRPRMTLTVGGRGRTGRGRPTPLATRITMPRRRQANLRAVRVTLPQTISARLTVINDACTRADFEADLARCAHAKAGTAVASTPLLREPLRGGVYFVKNGHPLPDLFVALRGQVAFDLIGRITIPGSRYLRTTFRTAPDVPIRSFALRLFGGSRNGSVGARANLCSARSRRQKARLDFVAQNGVARHVARALRVRGCAGHGRRRRRR